MRENRRQRILRILQTLVGVSYGASLVLTIHQFHDVPGWASIARFLMWNIVMLYLIMSS